MLQVILSVLKGVAFIAGAILDGLVKGGRAADRGDFLRGEDEPPTRQRTSHFYNGPGSGRGE